MEHPNSHLLECRVFYMDVSCVYFLNFSLRSRDRLR